MRSFIHFGVVMADTLENIPLDGGSWIDVYSSPSIDAGTPLDVQNIGTTDLYYSVNDIEPAKDSDDYRIIKRGQIARFIKGDLKVWFFSPTVSGLINPSIIDPSQNLVFSTDFLLEVAEGKRLGYSLVTISGVNKNVGNTGSFDIWQPPVQLNYANPAGQLKISSSSDEDKSGGTGASEITIIYLDANFVQKAEVVTLDGTNDVLTVGTDFYRHFDTIVTGLAVPYAKNIGTISVDFITSGDPFTGIYPLENHALNAHFSVPAGKTGYLTFIYTEVQKGKDATVRIEVTNGENQTFINVFPVSVYQNTTVVNLNSYSESFNEKTEFNPVAQSENPNTRVAFYARMLLVDND